MREDCMMLRSCISQLELMTQKLAANYGTMSPHVEAPGYGGSVEQDGAHNNLHPRAASSDQARARFTSGARTPMMRLGGSASAALRGRPTSRWAESRPSPGLRNLKDRRERIELHRSSSNRTFSDRSDIGFVCFVVLAVLYVIHFCFMVQSSRHTDLGKARKNDLTRGARADLHTSPAAKPQYTLPSHLQASSKKQNVVPGAILSKSKSFEGAIESEGANRNRNTLPGAILLEGTFDMTSLADSSDIVKTPKYNYLPTSSAELKIERPKELKHVASSKDSKSVGRAGVQVPDAAKRRTPTGRRGKLHAKTSRIEGSLRPKGVVSDTARNTALENGAPDDDFGSEAKMRYNGETNITHKKVNPTHRKLRKLKKKPKRKAQGEEFSVVESGPHPMSRTMTELQVEGGTGPLEISVIRQKYSALVKAYLAPFARGVSRKAFFTIMRRKNYSLAPPNSNKGIQTILFQIIKQKIYMMDPYEVAKNSKPFYKTRISELIWLLDRVAKKGIQDTEFLVAIHDCVQTVNKRHDYRGAHYIESSPTFTIVACNFSDNIPFPMWEGDEKRGGGFKGWDLKMEEYRQLDTTTSWARKSGKAVFRGGNRPSMYFAEKSDADSRCDDIGRSRLLHLSKHHPDIYDVSISGQCGNSSFQISSLSEADHHAFKFILYAEGNCFWADRLNKFVFGPSAIVKQETPCGQFWEPLLRPMTHYLPTDFFFSDTTDRIQWGNEHSEEVEKIVKNANEFALNFLSLSGIEVYVEVLLKEYTALLSKKEIKLEKGSIEAIVAP